MELDLGRVAPAVRDAAGPFLAELSAACGGTLHSLHVVGSAVTADWIPGRSDVNTLVLLRVPDLATVEAIAPLGRRWRRRGIAAPLVLDEPYVQRSLDVFPVEFLELRQVHETVLGEDILAGIEVRRGDLRAQCEREVKSRLIGLRQGYLGALGEPGPLRELLERFGTGYGPVFRAVVFLHGATPPARRVPLLAALGEATGLDTKVFGELRELRELRERKPSYEALRDLFERCYRATELLGRVVDELPA